MIEIQIVYPKYLIYGVLSSLREHDTYLAVYCTLLNNGHLGVYIYKNQQLKKRKKKR